MRRQLAYKDDVGTLDLTAWAGTGLKVVDDAAVAAYVKAIEEARPELEKVRLEATIRARRAAA